MVPPPFGTVAAGASAAWARRMRSARLGVVLRQQRLDRDLVELGVGQVGIAVGHDQLRRLDPDVDPLRVGHAGRAPGLCRRRVEPLQDVEQLQGDDAG